MVETLVIGIPDVEFHEKCQRDLEFGPWHLNAFKLQKGYNFRNNMPCIVFIETSPH